MDEQVEAGQIMPKHVPGLVRTEDDARHAASTQ
jgi:hypothetical protein